MYLSDILLNMYGEYADKDVLKTRELLELGLKNSDLAKLVLEGKLVRVKRGYYELADVEGLLAYSRINLGDRDGSWIKAKKAIYKALKLEPNNKKVQLMAFLNSIIDGDYDTALSCFQAMDEEVVKNNAYDQNLWLFLLSFLMELPEDYRERVSKMTYDNIKVTIYDSIYYDKVLHEEFRKDIMNHSFKEAFALYQMAIVNNKSLPLTITGHLLRKANNECKKKRGIVRKLINENNYDEALDLLTKEKELHGLSKEDEAFRCIISDLVWMRNKNEVPTSNLRYDDNDLYEAIIAKDYEKARSLNDASAIDYDSKRKTDKLLIKLIDGVSAEISRIKQESGQMDINKASIESVDEDKNLFEEIVSSFKNSDIGTAKSLIAKYLTDLGKGNYIDYVIDLVKIYDFDEDKDFSEPLGILTDIVRDELEVSPAIYFQDFYYNLTKKDFKKAALYLDILSMSEKLNGGYIDISNMKNRLLEELEKAGFSDVIEEVYESSNEADEDNRETQVQENLVTEESCPIAYTLTEVVDRVQEGENLIMLEPMSDAEIEIVVEATAALKKVRPLVIKEETGEQRVVLRYYNADGPYINVSDTFAMADRKLQNEEYQDAIDLYQLGLSKTRFPSNHVLAKLGYAYEKIDDYCSAIDCYKVSQALGKYEGNFAYNFGTCIDRLNKKCNYNGVCITGDSGGQAGVQYKK